MHLLLLSLVGWLLQRLLFDVIFQMIDDIKLKQDVAQVFWQSQYDQHEEDSGRREYRWITHDGRGGAKAAGRQRNYTQR